MTSHFSLTNKAVGLSISCYQANLSRAITKPGFIRNVLTFVESEILSRISALFISATAAFDLLYHGVMVPLSFVNALGKSIILWKADFSLPWEHLERVRASVVPILFGSAIGVLHPYAGAVISEPKEKYIEYGILLSRNKEDVQTICSPITTYDEVLAIAKHLPKEHQFNDEKINMVKTVRSWEGALEKIQSIEFFDLKLTKQLLGRIIKAIDHSAIPTFIKFIASRICLLSLPVFACLDLAYYVLTELFALSFGILQNLGIKAPIYMEATSSPELHIYSLLKIVLHIFQVPLGFLVSLFSPKLGLELATSKKPLIELALNLKKIFLNWKIDRMKAGERTLLPVVVSTNEDSILPSCSSHIHYLLIEKRADETFTAELIERGSDHRIRKNLTKAEVKDLAMNCMSLRFNALNLDYYTFFNQEFPEKETYDLGKQGHFNCCPTTNLFAAFEMLYLRDMKHFSDFKAMNAAFKKATQKRLGFLLDDVSAYPYADVNVFKTPAIIKQLAQELEKNNI